MAVENGNPSYDYVAFPRQFVSYRWFKPLLVLALGFVFMVVLCLALIPVQCVAEEYVFRGFFMQAVGSWFKLPVVGLIVSAAVFAAGHPYNEIGVALIFFNGVIWGLVTWLTKGLEASSAAHIVNNYIVFFLGGFGVQATTSNVDFETLIVGCLVDVIYAAAVILLGRKFGWFAPTGDGAAAFNEKTRARLAMKAARKQWAQQLQPQQPQPLQPPQLPQPPMRPYGYNQQPQSSAAGVAGREGEAAMSEKLELYYYPECPYCQKVLRAIDELGAAGSVELRNIHADASAQQTLVAVGGKQQVPCLFIDGAPLYESSDIVDWLRNRFA